MNTQQSGFRLSVITLALTLGLAGCVDDGDTGPAGPAGMDGANGVNGNNGAPGLAEGTFLIANNGDSNRGSVSLVDQNAALLNLFTSGNNEGIVLDSAGNLIQAGDSSTGSLRTVCRMTARTGGMFMTAYDKEITGTNTGLTNPKGIHLAQHSGLVFVADFNGMQISIFGSQAAGDVMPVAEIPLPAKPWDVTVDEVNDRMFVALTDGTVAVYDDVMGSDFAPAVMRSIVPADANGNQLSVNLHGIVYHAQSDLLVVSDVGDAAVADDGQLFVINGAAMADGNIQPARQISGPMSMLGNPVDIILSGTTLRVAEKSNDAILIFTNIFDGADGDIAPALATATSKPESLAQVMPMMMAMDASDNALTSATINGIVVSSNPATEGPATGQINQYSAVLSSMLANFDAGMSIESVTLDAFGDGAVTFDDPATSMGGVLLINRLASMRKGDSYSMSQDHMIMGASTGLVTPKGADVSSTHGLVFVAELNATTPGIKVFSSCASGDVAPLITLVASNGARPWDVDYDAQTDRAFVALTNGTVAVFDEVTRKLMNGMTTVNGENRLITPAMNGTAVAAPTNIHGIDYDAQSDSLVISDVGSAASATDGKLYVIPAAGLANGLSDMSVMIAGPNSMLGNPVDLMLSNGHAYVAEKSNNVIMRFDNILNSASGDIAPDFTMSHTAPESVVVIPAH
ncbi:YncE family protein [Alteromonas lipolytica]|uniref:NHL repeat containing protein n=1 Tax=Alteromonas lipolytica TaxID=1856405 RepID=A0A1E8FHK0_9ALTE|nr:hypothetical protein [Alteromonas lipolytica]OFI34943.1 hypothetical protein BFC17_15370 [Alteromonas lipolytica]GGF55291.1 hypothetical protein GCM10011338_04420 [Alteromonas lipolytica]